MKESVRQFQAAVTARDAEQAGEMLKTAYKELDRTAASGAIHKKAAARRKSRLAKQLDNIAAP